MVIVMNEHAPEDQIEKVIAALTQKGYDAHRSTGTTRTVIGVVGASRTPLDPREFEIMPGVHEVVRITEPYKLAGRTFQPEDTVIRIGDVLIGGRDLDRKSTRLNSSHLVISYAVFCLKKKKKMR